MGILVARYLGPEQYGLMNYVISFVFLFQTIAMFGLDSIEIREEARAKESFQRIIGTAFCLKMGLGMLMVAAVVVTSLFFETEMEVTVLVAVYSLSILANSFCVIRNYFTAIVDNEYVSKAEIARTLVSMLVKIGLLLCHAPLFWFVLASAFDYVWLASGYVMAYHAKVGRLREWRFDGQYAWFMLKEAFPLLLTNAAVIVYQRIDQVMIGQMIDKESVGYFSVASRFVEVLIFIPMILAQTITPVLVNIREHSQAEYEAKGQQFMNISLWLSLLCSAFMSIIAYWLIRYTFGEAYLPAVAVLQVMAFKTASVALSNTAGAMLVTEGLQRWAILRDGLGCVVCVVLNYILLPRYGIIAAAFIAILSNVAAGYIADALIPVYRHLFVRQTKALFLGWKDVLKVKSIVSRRCDQ